MASYIVMEPPGRAGAARADGVRLIPDAFSVPAFIVSPIWLLWRRLWIEAALVFVAGLLIVELADQLGMGPGGSALSLILSLFVGLEGQRLRVAALTRRGWNAWGVVNADSADDAFARYASAVAIPREPRPLEPVPAPMSWPSAPHRTGPSSSALGLVGYPGRR